MKFGYTICYVSDVVQTVKFYQKAFGLEESVLSPGGEYGELKTGDTKLAFAAEALGEKNIDGTFHKNSSKNLSAGIVLVLVTDDVDAALAKAIEAGATVVAKPAMKPWGPAAYVRDINGILVQLTAPRN